jgi:hypothetical protein
MGLSPEHEKVTNDRYYPKVLICALTRINKNDSFNNNLLLRNLFADWPRERLAQIYSGGSNGDVGFCGQQYQIAINDRQFGKLFFRLKGGYANTSRTDFSAVPAHGGPLRSSPLSRLKQATGRFIMDSGLYELIFKLRPSQQLNDWAEDFEPDIILAQGYNLTFTWLPLFLKRQLKIPLAYYCSDDWSTYLYASKAGLCAMTSSLMRRMVEKSTKQLLAATDVPFAFNDLMGKEYERRYDKSFTTLMHCDDPDRFIRAKPIRLHPPEIKSIVATGAFNDSRWPLLLELEEACQYLNDIGIPARATALTARITEEGYRRVKACRFVELKDDPGHELLPAYLKGADLLYLPETFDPNLAQGYRFSISTKAHLFMFSQRPILVYGHSACGVVTYARREGWAHVVDHRNIDSLKVAIKKMLTDKIFCNNMVTAATTVVMRNNNCYKIRKLFRDKIINILSK